MNPEFKTHWNFSRSSGVKPAFLTFAFGFLISFSVAATFIAPSSYKFT